jgi:hypothetical protein
VAFDFDPFIELLRDQHGLLRIESQLVGSFLLQAARRKRGIRLFDFFLLLDLSYDITLRI